MKDQSKLWGDPPACYEVIVQNAGSFASLKFVNEHQFNQHDAAWNFFWALCCEPNLYGSLVVLPGAPWTLPDVLAAMARNLGGEPGTVAIERLSPIEFIKRVRDIPGFLPHYNSVNFGRVLQRVQEALDER